MHRFNKPYKPYKLHEPLGCTKPEMLGILHEYNEKFNKTFPKRLTHVILDKSNSEYKTDIVLLLGKDDVIICTLGTSLTKMSNGKRFEAVSVVPISEFNKELCLQIHDMSECDKIREAIGIYGRVILSELYILSKAPNMTDDVFKNYETIEDNYYGHYVYHGLYKIFDMKLYEYETDVFYMLPLDEDRYELINSLFSVDSEKIDELLDNYYKMLMIKEGVYDLCRL